MEKQMYGALFAKPVNTPALAQVTHENGCCQGPKTENVEATLL